MPLPQGNETVSAWMTTDIPSTEPLTENLTVDVCVVGAGIAGLTTAYLLACEGKKVCVLENSEIGSGQTGKTTAHFSTSVDDYYHKLQKIHGTEGIKLIADSMKSAITKVIKISKNEKIECDLEKVPGFLFQNNRDTEILEKELKAVHEAGLEEVKMAGHAPFFSFNTGPCLCFPQQLQLHPLKYLKGLTESIYKREGRIFTQTHVEEIIDGDEPKVRTSEGFYVKAKSVVVATNSPINNLFTLHTKQAAYRSYVVGILIPKGSLPKALYWDTDEPYHYLRVAHENDFHDVLIVGGEDHKTGQGLSPHLCFERLEQWARKKFQFLGHVLYRWSGQVMEPADGIAFLGKNPNSKNIYVITGDSGDGMTFGTIGAMIITDQIQGRENKWAKIYDPARVKLRATGEYLKENLNVAAQYLDWIGTHNEHNIKELPKQEGMVITQGLKKLAVYKDEEGNLEVCSAACTHLNGIVAWNSVEKSWDCPCHGARYDCRGRVIEGPAVDDLEKITNEKVPQIRNEIFLENKGV